MKNLLIIGTVFPEPASTAAGTRMMQIIQMFQKGSYSVTFVSSAAPTDYSADIEAYGVKTSTIPLNHHSAEVLIKDINPDIVIFDRFMTEEQFGWKVSEVCPNAIKILDTEDLHFLRKAREKAFKENRVVEKSDLISDVFKREMASILRCDLSLIISEFELQLLTEEFKISPDLLTYLPIFADVKSSNKNFGERRNFISIGNFLHEPNWQTVLKLKKLWPEIKTRLPDAEMHIYGSYPTEKARQLHNDKEKFLIKGRAENIEKVFNEARVLLAPIPFGAGIKGKLLDSMALGLPNTTTEMGAEGMHQNGLWNGFITKTDEEFIEKTVLLYSDETLWKQARENGFKIIETRFKREHFEKNLLETVKRISGSLAQHRNENFLGQILQHHSLKSTKYLGKWIEEKNKQI